MPVILQSENKTKEELETLLQEKDETIEKLKRRIEDNLTLNNELQMHLDDYKRRLTITEKRLGEKKEVKQEPVKPVKEEVMEQKTSTSSAVPQEELETLRKQNAELTEALKITERSKQELEKQLKEKEEQFQKLQEQINTLEEQIKRLGETPEIEKKATEVDFDHALKEFQERIKKLRSL